MKKHILGLALFSLIVGLAVFVSAMFYKKVKKEYVYEVSNRSCWRQVKQETSTQVEKVKIVQAVFNYNTNQLNVEFLKPPTQNAEIYLIYAEQNSKTDWEGTPTVQLLTLSPSFKDKTTQSIMLNNIKGFNQLNMYISIKSNNQNDLFESKVPVLIMPKH